MARNRLPTNVLELRGAYKSNPQRKPKGEPEPVGDVGLPPVRFNAEQKEAWNDLVESAHAGVMCKADRIAVEVAACLLADFRTQGSECSSAKIARLDSLLARFGMTPSDRSKVTGKTPEKKSRLEAALNF